MSNASNFGMILQKPVNWGLNQYFSENKMVQDDLIEKSLGSASSVEVRTKTSNVALKALKALGAAFVIVFASPAYALGALFKFFSKQSKEASTADQVDKETSTTDHVDKEASSDSLDEEVNQMFSNKTESHRNLLLEILRSS